MSLSPRVRAVLAVGYISLIVLFISHTQGFDAQDYGIIAPLTFLSTLVLSAALMGYLFFYEPIRLIAENRSGEATRDFFTMVGTFLVGILAVLLVVFAARSLLVGAIS